MNKQNEKNMKYQTQPTETAKTLLNTRSLIETKLTECEAILGKARKGDMGLTLAEDKTPEWNKAKNDHAVWFEKYRQVNSLLSKIRKADGYVAVAGKRVCVYKYKVA